MKLQSVILYIEYMPSGEQFSEQRDIWATPYKFNGKELDAETGLYYYGARYYTPEIGIWLSVDPLSDKYPSLSPYAYCAGITKVKLQQYITNISLNNNNNNCCNFYFGLFRLVSCLAQLPEDKFEPIQISNRKNPVILIDPDGREIWTTSEGWAVMENAFNSTLGEKNNPFTYNSETGKVEFDGNKKIGKLDDKQQEIVDRYKSLADDKSFRVDVNVVDNDQKLDLGNGEMRSLKDNGWNGAAKLSDDGKQTSVYISKEPFYKDSATGEFTKNPQTQNMQGIISIHEIGGHAYGYQQKIFGNQNNNQTEIFEGRVRSIYKSMFLPNYIKNQPVMKH